MKRLYRRHQGGLNRFGLVHLKASRAHREIQAQLKEAALVDFYEAILRGLLSSRSIRC
jgi:hypothetical protein